MYALNESPRVKHTGVGNSKHSRGKVKSPRYPIAIERVVSRLDDLGIAATQAAERAGLGRTYITDLLEARKRSVNGRERLEALAKALECTPGFITGAKAVRTRLPEPTHKGLALAGIIHEGVIRAVPPRSALPSLPVAPDTRYPGSQAVFAVSGGGLPSVGAPAGAWLLGVDARDFIRAAGGYRPGQLVVVALIGGGGEELVVRRVVTFPERIELHPVEGEGPVYTLGRQPRGRRLEIRAVVLKAVQELA